jgi:cytochrome c oxidase subunit 3
MMTLVTAAPVASSAFDTSRVHSLTRPNMVSVGTIIWLSSELMFFAGLFAMYFTARARSLEGWPPEPTELNLPYATVFTLILVASSFTCRATCTASAAGSPSRSSWA